MTRERLLSILGVEKDDIYPEALEMIEDRMNDEICITHPDVADKIMPVPPEALCDITGWERTDNGFALRCHNRKATGVNT